MDFSFISVKFILFCVEFNYVPMQKCGKTVVLCRSNSLFAGVKGGLLEKLDSLAGLIYSLWKRPSNKLRYSLVEGYDNRRIFDFFLPTSNNY